MTELIEKLSKLAAFGATFCLLLSVVYDYFFLVPLGLTFAEVPTTLADHVRTGIVWAPLVFTLLFGVFLSKLYEPVLDKLFVDIKTGPDGEPIKHPRRWTYRILLAASLWGVVYGSFKLPLMASLLTALTFVWIFGAPMAVLSGLFKMPSAAAFSALFYAGMVVGMVATNGARRAESMLLGTEPPWEIVLKTAEGTEKMQLIGLRRFSETAILVNQKREVRIVPNESIVYVVAGKPKLDRSIFCRLGEWACPQHPLASTHEFKKE
jgi:hypothetical protein